MTDLKVCCPSCKDEHSEDRNRNVIKLNKYWIELIRIVAMIFCVTGVIAH